MVPVHRALLDVAGIAVMLDLPGEDLVHLWIKQDVGFPPPRENGGILWARADVERWARAWGWRR